MLSDMRDRGEGFYEFANRMSREHQRWFNRVPLAEERRHFFEEAARASLERQAAIEAADDVPFDEYLRRYFAQI